MLNAEELDAFHTCVPMRRQSDPEHISQMSEAAAGEAGEEMAAQAKALLLQPSMLKKLINSKSAVPVRSACCELLALLCRRHAQHLPPCRLLQCPHNSLSC